MKYQNKSFQIGGYDKQKQLCDRCMQEHNAFVSSQLGHLCMACYSQAKEEHKLKELINNET